jgi:hypothetical protein
MAAAVWPPDQDQESWARFTLAKQLLQEGLRPQVLLQCLAMAGEEEEEPTAFRLDMASACECVWGVRGSEVAGWGGGVGCAVSWGGR